MEEVKEILNKLNIKYDIIYHTAVYTSEEADLNVKDIKCSKAKNLFLAGKNDKNFYLFIIKDTKMLNIKSINSIIGDKLHFANEKQLKEKMDVSPGMVSMFGLLNNKEHDIRTFIDKELLDEKLIAFHPNDNTATILIAIKDMLEFLEKLNFNYKIINL